LRNVNLMRFLSGSTRRNPAPAPVIEPRDDKNRHRRIVISRAAI